MALVYSTFTPTHIAVAAPAPPAVTASELFTFYYGATDFYFYTADPKMRAFLKTAPGWKELPAVGYVFREQAPGTVKLYQLAKLEFGGSNHFYTIDENEANNAIQNLGWTSEGIACYVSPTPVSGTMPLYRLYRPYSAPSGGGADNWLVNLLGGEPFSSGPSGDGHFYTNVEQSKFAYMKSGWTFIHTEAHVWTSAVTLGESANPAPSVPESYYTDHLINLGCKKSWGGYNCPTVMSYDFCEGYRKQGKIKAPVCTAVGVDLETFKKDEAFLVGQGCKRFLGRAGEYNCESWAGGDFCALAVMMSKGLITKCYSPQTQLERSYQDSFGREPTAKEITSAKNAWVQGTYTSWMKVHIQYLKSDAAASERIGLINRNFLEVRGLMAPKDELNIWNAELVKPNTPYPNYTEMRKRNIDWILMSANDALLRDIVVRALISAGSGKPSEGQITDWKNKAHSKRLTFKQMVAMLLKK